MRTAIRRHPVAAFFILAFALSWWPWPFVLLNPASVAIVPFGPLIAAVVVAAVIGRGELRALLAATVRWRVGLLPWLVAILLPIAVIAAAGIATAAAGRPIAMAMLAEWFVLPLSFLTTTIVAGPLVEEIGWRGFALPRIAARRGPIVASVALGLLWAAWHLPLMVSDPTRQREPIPFAIFAVGSSLVFTWLYLAAGRSVLLPVVMHGVINTTGAFVFQAFAPADRVLLWSAWAGAWAVAGVVAAVILVRARADGFEGAAGEQLQSAAVPRSAAGATPTGA